jgi:hypothetical protein
LLSQADQLSELVAARDDIRNRLTLALGAAELKYQRCNNRWAYSFLVSAASQVVGYFLFLTAFAVVFQLCAK